MWFSLLTSDYHYNDENGPLVLAGGNGARISTDPGMFACGDLSHNGYWYSVGSQLTDELVNLRIIILTIAHMGILLTCMLAVVIMKFLTVCM